jgi:hypothetical protein
MANRASGNAVAAMVIVGLGMMLIAALSGVVLYVVTQRKGGKQVTGAGNAEIPSAGVEPAEA